MTTERLVAAGPDTDPYADRLIAERPAGAPPRPYVFPEVRRLTAPGGGAIVAAHLPGRALAWAGLVLECGALHEPDGLDGLSRVTAGLVDEGTRGYSADDFALALEGLGARWTWSHDWETQCIGVDVPAARAADGVGLLAEAVRRAAFADEDVDRYLADVATSLKHAWAQPGTRAQIAYRRALFGADSRFGRLLDGTPESNARITADDIRAFHARRMTAPGTLLVAADLDTVDPVALGALVFADADPGAPDRPAAVPAIPDDPDRTRVFLVDRPGAVQSVLRLGHTAPPRSTPDLVAIDLFSEVLGGSFTSRVNHQLREVKGYTYGAGASFAHGRRIGSFAVAASVHTEVTAAALADALAEVRTMHEGGVTEEEFTTTRAHALGSMPIGLQSPRAIGARLREAVVHGLPDDHVTREYEAIVAAERADLDRAAATYLRPDALTVVVEGDAEAVLPGLEANGFEVVRADDV
ncbi:M16 family metallopeptidase [Yinghuangia seranimata]|uniref:M16 family metallopeptidase n=1 Tax=Yinghuangia seranimata TaxID=408067 RepID=UPI00248A9C06|nr:pitrilysin family protein [Yinghuangia seranimata]MDI2125911.1 pitrilysin family protein [Yinghuangia seranimata]